MHLIKQFITMACMVTLVACGGGGGDVNSTPANSSQVVPADMVLIPTGSFQMGDNIGGGFSEEHPVHAVTLSAFYLDRFEVTKSVWAIVCNWANVNGYTFDNPGTGAVENHPIIMISWFDVIKWLNARSEMDGRTPVYYTDSGQQTVYRTGQVAVTPGAVNWLANGYRLPTEAEWEYAYRGGMTTRFYTGMCISTDQANYDGRYDPTNPSGSSECPQGNYRGGIMPVGSFSANPWGLYDMAGNVSEWTWDWFYGYPSSSVTNPKGPDSSWGRVVRGGGWNEKTDHMRLAFRSAERPVHVSDSMGFRSALSQL